LQRQVTRLGDVAGLDAAIPAWAKGADPTSERPAFDSVVVCGNGIGASVLAARLARSESFAGRVVVAAPPVEESRQLVGGLTLRSRALDYYAAAFGSTRSVLLDLLFPDGAEPATTTHQMGSVFDLVKGGSAGALRPANAQAWMRTTDHGGRPLAYGIRNSHLAARLAELARELPIEFHEEAVDSLEAARALAPGSNPLVVNATVRPLVGTEAQQGKEAARAVVVASQLPFTARRRRECGVLGDGASLMAVVLREGRNDMGVFNPLIDALSPTAEYYGIVFRLLRPSPAPDKASEQSMMRDQLVRIADSVGLEPVDIDETEGRALIPCVGWKSLRSLEAGVLELNRLYHAGYPIITGDGMTKAGLTGLVCAEAILVGADPNRAANAALRKWRRLNHRLSVGLTSMARIASAGIRFSPRHVLGAANLPDTWAGVEGVA
jgi:hypothetical protein